MTCEELIEYLQQFPKDYQITITNALKGRTEIIIEADILAIDELKEVTIHAK